MCTLRGRRRFSLAGLPLATGATIECHDLLLALGLLHQRLVEPKDLTAREAIARAIEQHEAGFGARWLPRDPAQNTRTSNT